MLHYLKLHTFVKSKTQWSTPVAMWNWDVWNPSKLCIKTSEMLFSRLTGYTTTHHNCIDMITTKLIREFTMHH